MTQLTKDVRASISKYASRIGMPVSFYDQHVYLNGEHFSIEKIALNTIILTSGGCTKKVKVPHSIGVKQIRRSRPKVFD